MDRVVAMELVRAFQIGQLTLPQFLSQISRLLNDPKHAELLAQEALNSPIRNPGPVVAAELDGSELVSIGEQDALRGYLAEAAAAVVGVVVIQEWWGLNDHIKDVADRFARAGMLAVAPDLYHGVVTSEPDEARKAVMELDMDQAVREIQAAVDYLHEREGVQGVAVIGFCMGGRLALRMGAEGERLAAAVAFYGRPLESDQAAQISVPLLGIYGTQDQGIPVEGVKAMQRQIQAPNEFHFYEGAGHAFFNDTRASYDAEAASDAWGRTLAWIREHAGKA